MGRSPREAPLEHAIAGSVRARRVLITGAGGQLGAALARVFEDEAPDLLTHEQWDVTEPLPSSERYDLVLHAAAWTNVDGAEEHRVEARRVNVEGTRNVVALGASLVYFSTDYVFDGTKREPYVESDRTNPISWYGATKLEGEQVAAEAGAWVVRSSWLFGAGGRNFVDTMRSIGAKQPVVEVVDDQRGCPTYCGHLAEAVRELVGRALPRGVYHLAAEGECTWADLAEETFSQAGLSCQVERIGSGQLVDRPAKRPAYSVLRSEHPAAPRLPHWQDGLREYLR